MNDPTPQPHTAGPTPPPDHVGMIGGIVKIIQSMTLTHVLIMALIIVVLAPTYVLYRFMNDSSLLNKWTCSYEELATENSPCTLRIASQRGADPTYAISDGLCVSGLGSLDRLCRTLTQARRRRPRQLL